MLDPVFQQRDVARLLYAPAWHMDGTIVHRALPSPERHAVGPFILLDAFGPSAGEEAALHMAPHPHIGLIQITYLVDGSIEHRDSLGNRVRLDQGDLGVTVAGRGVTVAADDLSKSVPAHGIKAWIALPPALEDCLPSFSVSHGDAFAVAGDPKVRARVLLGSFAGASAPIELPVDGSMVDLTLAAGAQLRLPATSREQAILVLDGTLDMAGADQCDAGQLTVLRPGIEHVLTTGTGARAILVEGAALDRPPHVYWNFASRRSDRIDQAVDAWHRDQFPSIPGETDRAPLPRSQRHREA